MSNEEITEVTYVEKKAKSPSFFLNVLVLLGLFFLIQGSIELSTRWVEKTPKERSVEKQVVFGKEEGVEPTKIREVGAKTEAATVTVKKEVEAMPMEKAETTASGEEAEETQEVPEEKSQPAPPPKKKTVQKNFKEPQPSRRPRRQTAEPNPYRQPDSYTSGGELDLDSEAARQTYRQQNVIKVPADEAAADPVYPNETERDRYIPFEN